MRRELLSNDLRGNLSSAVDSTTTTIPLTSGAAFPAEGDYRIVVDNEIMLVKSKTGNNLTVVRAQEGTSATAHASDVSVLQVVTKAGLTRLIKEYADPWAESNRPPFRCHDSNGDLLDHNDFTTVGTFTGGTVSSVGKGGPITIEQTGQASEYIAAAVRAAPTPPYSLIMCLEYEWASPTTLDGPIIGPIFRESATSKLLVWRWRPCADEAQELRVNSYTNESTFNASASNYYEIQNMGNRMWYKLTDNNTNITMEFSLNGINWKALINETRGTNFTTAPDQIGWCVDNLNTGSLVAAGHLLSWTGE